MPRKTNRVESNVSESEQKRKQPNVPVTPLEGKTFFQRTKSFLLNERTQQVCGIVLALLSLFAAIACISFFFTGANDQSLIDQPREARLQSRQQIQNVLGLPGAMLSDWLIDDLFGLPSVGIIVLLVYFSLRLLHIPTRTSTMRMLLCSLFWLTWGAITLAYLQQMAGVELLAYGTQTLLEQSEVRQFNGWVTALLSFLIVLLTHLGRTGYIAWAKKRKSEWARYFLTTTFLIGFLLFLWSAFLVWCGFILFVLTNYSLNLGWALTAFPFLGGAGEFYGLTIRRYLGGFSLF